MTKDYFPYIVLTVIIILAGVYGFVQYRALGATVLIESRATPLPLNVETQITTVDLLTSTSTAATSSSVNTLGAKKITIFAIMDGFVSTTSAKYPYLSITYNPIATTTDPAKDVEDVTTSGDATTTPYVRYNKLVDDVVNSISQNLTRVNVKPLSATTTLVSMDLTHDIIPRIRCHVSNINQFQTGQGVTCRAIIQY